MALLAKEWEDMDCILQTQAAWSIISKNLAEKQNLQQRSEFLLMLKIQHGSIQKHAPFLLWEIHMQDKSKLKFLQLICIYEHCQKRI